MCRTKWGGGYDDGGRHGKQHDSGDGESGLYGGSDGNCEKGRRARRHDYSCTLAGSESVEEFYGITVQQEKEVIAIVSSAAKRKDIMEAINRNHGMKTEARGTVCSLAIEDIVRLG